RLEEAVRLEAEDSEVEGYPDAPAADDDADTEPNGRTGFGASALDRLSEAINSVTSSAPEKDDEYLLEPNTVAEEALATQRSLREHRLKSSTRGKRLKLVAIIGSVVGLVALVALLAPGAIEFIQNYEGDAAPPPTLAVTDET